MTFPALCLVFKSKDTLYSQYSVKYRLLDYAILKQSLVNKAGYKINNHNFKETRLIFLCLVKYSFQCHPDKNPEIKKKNLSIIMLLFGWQGSQFKKKKKKVK